MYLKKEWLLGIALSASLAACGGSGSNDDASDENDLLPVDVTNNADADEEVVITPNPMAVVEEDDPSEAENVVIEDDSEAEELGNGASDDDDDINVIIPAFPDGDSDGIEDSIDNCPIQPNADQSNVDGDALGDACDTDDDNDGFADAEDCGPGDQNIFPGAPDDAMDGIDSNCDGVVENLPPPNPVVDGYEYINDGNGAADFISESDDVQDVGVVQTVPVTNSPVPVSVDTPITLFFDDQIFLDSLFNNFTVMENGAQIPGTVTITESSNGQSILTFVPSQPYQEGSTVNLMLTGGEQGVLDSSGNQLVGNSGDNFEFVITTFNPNAQSFDTNLSFENFDEGVVFSGDGAVLTGQFGCLAPIEGNNFAAISTGDAIVSNDFALDGTSSTMQIGPIIPASSTFSFSFNFASGEFQEFVGSEFDDSSVLSITGPGGSFTEILTTVNIVGTEGNTECLGIPELTGLGDEDDYAGQIGWNDRSIDISGLGSPLTITFTVTDVADELVSSILAIDDIRF